MRNAQDDDAIAIVGAGVGGLVLALELHRLGIRCEIFEAVPEIRPLGVGINLLPHATHILKRLGVVDALTAVAVTTKEAVFCNRYGQRIYTQPCGQFAGYAEPQLSIHRGDLQKVLLRYVYDRMGAESVHLDSRCEGVDAGEHGVVLSLSRGAKGESSSSAPMRAVVACDGIHSAIRKQFYPHEGSLKYTGITMWRGVTVSDPFLSGATMLRMGWFQPGKLVAYPIRHNVDGAGRQLINWVAELETPQRSEPDWSGIGFLDDFIAPFADWTFDWLDVPALMREADQVLEYPMVDRDPLPRWSFGAVTLLGDAAHPMVPRGSNGAGQAILDAASLARFISTTPDIASAFRKYEDDRLSKTSRVVLENRANPPDRLLFEVRERTGDKPFGDINEVISADEIRAIARNYQEIAGLTKEAVSRL